MNKFLRYKFLLTTYIENKQLRLRNNFNSKVKQHSKYYNNKNHSKL